MAICCIHQFCSPKSLHQVPLGSCFLYIKRSTHRNFGKVVHSKCVWVHHTCLEMFLCLSYSFCVDRDTVPGNYYLKIPVCCPVAMHGVNTCMCIAAFISLKQERTNSLQMHNVRNGQLAFCIFFSTLFLESFISISYNETGNNLIGVFYTSVFKFSKHLCISTMCQQP